MASTEEQFLNDYVLPILHDHWQDRDEVDLKFLLDTYGPTVSVEYLFNNLAARIRAETNDHHVEEAEFHLIVAGFFLVRRFVESRQKDASIHPALYSSYTPMQETKSGQ